MDEISLETLGRHLQALRQARGLSLSQLAGQAAIAKSNLSRLEQGNGNPTIDTLWRLARQLRVPFGTLIAPIATSVEDSGVSVQLIEQSQGRGEPAVEPIHAAAPLASSVACSAEESEKRALPRSALRRAPKGPS